MEAATRGEPVPRIAPVDLARPGAPPSNDGPQFFRGGDFRTEAGGLIPDLSICYETWGQTTGFRGNVVLLCHGRSGDRQSLGHLIGPGRPFDPERYFVIATDAIGAGFSSSPASTGLGPNFPRYNIRDVVRAQCLLLTRELGLTSVRCVAGPSMGAYMAIEWAVMYPAFVKSAGCIVPAPRCSPHLQSIHEAMRVAIKADPAFNSGNYGVPPAAGLSAAAAVTFPWSYGEEWYLQYADQALYAAHVHAARERVFSLDANAVIAAANACDDHDIAEPFEGDMAAALRRCHMPVLVMPCASDMLIPPWNARLMASLLPHAVYEEIPSYAGHAATSLEADFVGQRLARFLETRS